MTTQIVPRHTHPAGRHRLREPHPTPVDLHAHTTHPPTTTTTTATTARGTQQVLLAMLFTTVLYAALIVALIGAQ